MRTIIFAILILLVMAAPSFAGCGHVVHQAVAVPVVNEVIVPVPVYVPTFQFQYQPPVCMPAAIPPAASPVGLSSDENIKALARAIMEEMRKENAVGAGPGKVEEDDGPPMVVEAGAVGITPHPPALPIASTSFAILSNRCAKCHTGKSADGGFSIFESPGKLEQNLDWDSIVRAVSTGRMPKEAQKNPKLALSQAEIQTLKNRR